MDIWPEWLFPGRFTSRQVALIRFLLLLVLVPPAGYAIGHVILVSLGSKSELRVIAARVEFESEELFKLFQALLGIGVAYGGVWSTRTLLRYLEPSVPLPPIEPWQAYRSSLELLSDTVADFGMRIHRTIEDASLGSAVRLAETLDRFDTSIRVLAAASGGSRGNLSADHSEENATSGIHERLLEERLQRLVEERVQRAERRLDEYSNDVAAFRRQIEEEQTKERAHQTATQATIAEIRQRIGQRLDEQSRSFDRRGNLNLTIGVVTTGVALSVLVWMAINAPRNFSGSGEMAAYFIPRASVGLLVQALSYFFLTLYRRAIDEIKYFQNELTNIESRLCALDVALVSGDTVAAKAILLRLGATDRNMVLAKGQSTVDLEKHRIDNSGRVDLAALVRAGGESAVSAIRGKRST